MKLKLFYIGTKGNIYPDNVVLHAATLIDSLVGFCTLGLIQPAFSERVAVMHLKKQIDRHRAKRKVAKKTAKVHFKISEENEWLSMRGKCRYGSSHYEYGVLCDEPGRLEDPVGFKLCEQLYCPGISIKAVVR